MVHYDHVMATMETTPMKPSLFYNHHAANGSLHARCSTESSYGIWNHSQKSPPSFICTTAILRRWQSRTMELILRLPQNTRASFVCGILLRVERFFQHYEVTRILSRYWHFRLTQI